eukprot:9365925-Pyramimonas_sp.AAC.1
MEILAITYCPQFGVSVARPSPPWGPLPTLAVLRVLALHAVLPAYFVLCNGAAPDLPHLRQPNPVAPDM